MYGYSHRYKFAKVSSQLNILYKVTIELDFEKSCRRVDGAHR